MAIVVALLARGEHDVPLVASPTAVRQDAGRLKERVKRERTPLPAPLCPAGVPDCVSVTGRVIYVETLDPDGDGDLHVVVAAGSVTARGVTAIDVRTGLRPARDPLIGDRAAAAGPVQTGSHKQRQIHALTFTVVPR